MQHKKPQPLAKYHFQKNQEKFPKTPRKQAILKKIAFLAVSLDYFFRDGTSLRAVLHSVHQDSNFGLAKTSIRQFF